MSRSMVGSRIFVGGLPYQVRERDIERFFKEFGVIREILLKKGYCFVEFDDYRDADDAVYELNGKELMGERVSVEKARGTPRGSDVWRGSGRPPRDYGPPPPRRRSRGRDRDGDHRNNERYGPPTRTEYRLIVENLSSRVSWQDLKDYMRQAGEVTYADAHKQRRNEGVVEFNSYSDMKNAIERLDDTELNGRRIHLVEDKHRRRSHSSSSRSRSRSRSRGRDRSKSRSRSSRSASRSRSKSPVRSRSKSASPGRSKSRSPSAPKTKRSRSRSNSVANHKRTKRSESESSDKRSRSVSRERNGRSDGSGDEDD
ncbi:serine-arginine protein 55 isoform X2 [Planococcus citri]|uniref:serine-arginine protein 55 isoform X2 n=1 Tax=Planococcus citri TaxID=170843 RepID=UPI0031F800C5